MSMKILVLCVDRDDDIGVKTGIKAPLVGREDNLAAATKLGLAETADSLYVALGRQLKNPKVTRKIVAPLGLVLLLFGAIWLAVPNAAPALVLILAGLYLLMISLPFQSVGVVFDKAGRVYARIRDSVASGDLSIFFNVSALILLLVGIFFGADSAGRTLEPSYVVSV